MGTARIAKGDLAGLDALSVDALALGLWRSVKQPVDVAGFLDWRLCGRIGRLLLKKKFSGADGETLLMAPLGRIGAKRIFLFGLGAERELSDVELGVNAVAMISVLVDAGVKVVAVAGSAKMLEHWLIAAKNAKTPFDEVVLLDPDGALANAAKSLAAAAKRGGLEWMS